MTPCPLCWLREHGFPEIPEEHGKEWWEWLHEHAEDRKVKEAFEGLPSGIDFEDES